MNKLEKINAVSKGFEKQEPVKSTKRLLQMDLRLLRGLLGVPCTVGRKNRLNLL